MVEVPYIDHRDPLPAPPEPEGRWMVPMIDSVTGEWMVLTRYPVPPHLQAKGLKPRVDHPNMEGLKTLMHEQDVLAAEQGYPSARAHRNTD